MAEIDKELDFDIVAEPWNKYKLEDGTIIRLKNPLLKIFVLSKLDNLGQPVYRIGGINLISTTVPVELKGQPSADQKINPAVEKMIEMKFATILEDWCEYKLSDGGVFRSKLVVTKIFKTPKYNVDGDPIYFCNWQVLTDKSPPPK